MDSARNHDHIARVIYALRLGYIQHMQLGCKYSITSGSGVVLGHIHLPFLLRLNLHTQQSILGLVHVLSCVSIASSDLE